MIPERGYIPVESRYPLRGLNSSVPSTQVGTSYTPDLDNVFIREGVIYKRPGYKELVNQALDGTVLALKDFELLDGTRILVAMTTTRQYKFNNTTAWTDITATQSYFKIVLADTTTDFFNITNNFTNLFLAGAVFVVTGSTGNNGTYTVDSSSFANGVTTIQVATVASAVADGFITGVYYPVTDVDIAANWFKVTGDQTTIFPVGAKFIVRLSTGNDGEYTVTAVSFAAGKTQISVADVVSAVADGQIEKLQLLTSIEGDYIDFCVGTDNTTHRLYLTNGRDRVRFWDGGSGRFLIWNPEYPDFVTCKTLDVFVDHLMLGNITLTGINPKMIAWSDVTEFNEFVAGDAGDILIPAIDGAVWNFEVLGDRLIAYCTNSIVSAMFIGLPVVFLFDVLSQDIRLTSPRSIVSFGSAHLYVSQENIYFFDGTRGVRGVGDIMRVLYKQQINFQYGLRLFCFNDVAKRMITIAVPTSSSTAMFFVLDYDVFDLNQFIWTRGMFIDVPSCMGWFTRRSGIRWIDLVGTWEQWVGIWADESSRIGFPVRLMGSGSRVYTMEETFSLDNATEVTAFYATSDFTVPGAEQSIVGRWIELECDLAGSAVSFYYSTGQGTDWTLVETRPIDSEFSSHVFLFDVTTRTIRFKFESKTYFAIRQIKAWVRPSSAR